jgi:hypothetical protein
MQNDVEGIGWSTAQSISNSTETELCPQIAISSCGTAIVVWEQWDSGAFLNNVHANRYVTGISWDTTKLL